jgi:hypothetical protein
MPSAAFNRFKASMNIGYIEWHDGIGYDLDALRELGPEEVVLAETLVIERSLRDWRDIEALDCIGTERSLAELKKALASQSLEVRLAAVERLVIRGLLSSSEFETIVLDALARTTLLDGMTRALRLAASRPTPAIRKKLLSCARDGNDDIRVHAAALAHFLYGCSSSAFDMRLRPLYLRFNSKDARARQAAYEELCATIIAAGHGPELA